jgi:hypothetical protein
LDSRTRLVSCNPRQVSLGARYQQEGKKASSRAPMEQLPLGINIKMMRNRIT